MILDGICYVDGRVDQDPKLTEVAYFGRAAAPKRSPAVGRTAGVLGPITLSDAQIEEWRREEAGRA